MGDLRSDVKDYFEHFVHEVDLDDVLDPTRYVIDALPTAEERPQRARSRFGGPVAAAVVGVLIWGIIAMTGNTPSDVDVVSTPPSASPSTVGSNESPSSFEPKFPYVWGEPRGGFRLQKSATGPQDAEAILYWIDYPDSEKVTLCGLFGDFAGGLGRVQAGLPIPPDSPAQAVLTDPNFNLMNEVSNLIASDPGLRLVSGPNSVLLDGFSGVHLSLEIESDEGCDPGYISNWRAEGFGAMWFKYSVGDTIDVWVVDTIRTERAVLLIVGIADPEFPTLRDEIRQLVSAVTFQSS